MLQVLGRKTDSGSERGSTTLFGITAKHFSHKHCQLGITQFFALSDVWRTASEAHTLTGKAARKMSTRCVWKRAVRALVNDSQRTHSIDYEMVNLASGCYYSRGFGILSLSLTRFFFLSSLSLSHTSTNEALFLLQAPKCPAVFAESIFPTKQTTPKLPDAWRALSRCWSTGAPKTTDRSSG